MGFIEAASYPLEERRADPSKRRDERISLQTHLSK